MEVMHRLRDSSLLGKKRDEMNMKEMIVGIDGINKIQLVVTGRIVDVEVAEKRERWLLRYLIF